MISCGIDVESLDRVNYLYRQGAMPLGLFSDIELRCINSDIIAAHAFVAKEAVLKSLGAGWFNTDVDAHDIELGFDVRMMPTCVTFHGAAKRKVDEGDFKSHTLDFFYFGRELLALFVLSGTQNNSMKKSVVVVDRIQLNMRDLCSNETLELQPADETYLVSTKLLGKLAVKKAVCEITNKCRLSANGYVGHDSFGAPIWVESLSMGFPADKIDAVSITHNRNYACGAAIIDV